MKTVLLGILDVVSAPRVKFIEHSIHHRDVQRQQAIQKPLDGRNFVLQDLSGFFVDKPDAHLPLDIGDGDAIDPAFRDGKKERNKRLFRVVVLQVHVIVKHALAAGGVALAFGQRAHLVHAARDG